LILAAVSVLSLTGCVSTILAHKVVAPPNKSGIKPLFSDLGILEHAPEAFAETWIVPIRQPRADIAVASIEPGDYAFEYDLRLTYADGKAPTISHFSASWRAAAEVARYPVSKGTVILLHGFLQNRNSMTPWAIRLAQAGYRCAVLDLRGQGASTGKHISFGAFEARDVSAVIDDLGRRGWDVSRVGLLGISYGASVALLTAGSDTRVKTVVAFEPFASAERAVPELMRAVFTEEGGRDFRPSIRRGSRQAGEGGRLRLEGRRHSRSAEADPGSRVIPARRGGRVAVARPQPHAVPVRARRQQARAGAEGQSRDTSVADRAVRIGGDCLARRRVEASLVAVIPLQSFRGGLCISWLGGILENPACHRRLGATGQRRGAHTQDHGT
jgi:pimeloyl-ACP methyl ester carboxylesterase